MVETEFSDAESDWLTMFRWFAWDCDRCVALYLTLHPEGVHVWKASFQLLRFWTRFPMSGARTPPESRKLVFSIGMALRSNRCDSVNVILTES